MASGWKNTGAIRKEWLFHKVLPVVSIMHKTVKTIFGRKNPKHMLYLKTNGKYHPNKMKYCN